MSEKYNTIEFPFNNSRVPTWEDYFGYRAFLTFHNLCLSPIFNIVTQPCLYQKPIERRSDAS